MQGTLGQNLTAVVTGALGVTALAIAVIGVFHRPLSLPGRVVAALAGVLLLFQDLLSAAIGIALMAALWALTEFRARKHAT